MAGIAGLAFKVLNIFLALFHFFESAFTDLIFSRLRIRIVFGLKNRGDEVPFHHQYILAQMIKGVLISGNNADYINFRDYNFSGLKGQTRISRKGLHFYSAKVTMVFSCLNKGFVDYFLHQLFNFPEIVIGNLKLAPESIEVEQGIQVTDEMKYVCISPIVLKLPKFQNNSSKNFIHPELDEFSDLLYDCTMERLELSKLFTTEQIASFYKFQIVPDKHYLNKLSVEKKKFARIYPVYEHDVKYEVRGYTFPFTLYAAKEVQEFIYNSGLGQLAHKGFGMLDVVNTKIVERKKLISYEPAIPSSLSI